jgi:hypothetical protein
MGIGRVGIGYGKGIGTGMGLDGMGKGKGQNWRWSFVGFLVCVHCGDFSSDGFGMGRMVYRRVGVGWLAMAGFMAWCVEVVLG